ncbi:hypothetical protein [Pseudoxanthomonas japonensis]|uniref:hypothetical protein n=1 Tax=Pseudoxanthomonas japonensis TaxID=69284 RepID=UPI0013918D62|nr:hypothetical protein [Pseudoxanthomonas japonensis]
MPRSTQFPRPVFDETGVYTINEAGTYEVISPSVQRYHELVFSIRDLHSAHEMMEQCCRNDLDDLHPLLEQGLWVGAVIQYSKPFKANHARRTFDAGNLVRTQATESMRDFHHYLITLRDKMFAHDDALGECKQVAIGLPYKRPRHPFEIGIEPTNPRVISLGGDIARDAEPHFRAMLQLFEQQRNQIREETIGELFRTNLNEVTLVGPARKTALEVGRDDVAARWPRKDGQSAKQSGSKNSR